MKFNFPDLKLPDLNFSLPAINMPEFKRPNIEIPDFSNTTVGATIDEYLNKIPVDKLDLSAVFEKFNIDASFLDKVELNGFELSFDMNALGELTGMDIGSITSGMNIDPSSYMSSIEMPNINDYMSNVDLSELEGLDGVNIEDFSTDIDMSAIQNDYDLSALNTDYGLNDLKMSLDIRSLVFGGSMFSGDSSMTPGQKVDEIINTLSNLTASDVVDFAYNKIKDEATKKIESVKKTIETVKDIYSYVDMDRLDFSSWDAIRNNDYKGVAIDTVLGYANAKLEPFGGSLTLEGVKLDIGKMMSGMGMDSMMPDFEMPELDMSGMNDFEMDTSELDLDTSSLELDGYGVDFSEISSEYKMPSVDFDMTSITSEFAMPDLSKEMGGTIEIKFKDLIP